jgi:V/A-type H+-transporting ATPase subunit C
MGKNVYASVKSYSQRGKLLKKEDFQTLAESRDLEELMRNHIHHRELNLL